MKIHLKCTLKCCYAYLCCMEAIKKKIGRPVVPADLRKKNRAVSLTDTEYQVLEKLAAEKGIGVSAYIIKRLKLS